MYMSKEDIKNRVKEHYMEVNEDYEVLGVFLKGSQNYIEDLFSKKSDVDSCAVILPSNKEILLGIETPTVVKHLDNKEQITILDVRKLVSSFNKSSMNNLEPLFTEYFYIDEEYKEFFDKMKSIRESIAYMKPKEMAMYFMGVSLQDYKNLTSRSGGEDSDILEYGYSRKRLSHIIRFNNSLKSYIAENKFSEVIKSTSQEEIHEIRRKEKYKLEQALELAESTIKETTKLAKEYEASREKACSNEVKNLTEEYLMELLMKSLSINWR